jgi:hypothetical protein
MSQLATREYIDKMRERYSRMTGKAAKSTLLDEVCHVCGFDRKYAIKVMAGQRRKPPSEHARRGRGEEFGPEAVEVLRKIWAGCEYACGKRLRHALKRWLPHYEARHGQLSEEVRAQVLKISAAQIDRRLGPYRAAARRRANGGTKPGSLLRNQIPVRTHFEKLDGPGWLEADTVAHCGGSMSGDFIWSLTMTDVYSGWTECRAVWNKGQAGLVAAVADVEAGLPFDIAGFDCDNGSEFLNWHLKAYLEASHGGPEGNQKRRSRKINFTRSRPYRKNDNCHVEQKNWTHPRALLGYDRLDDPGLVAAINRLYAGPWMHLQNFFIPAMKLVEKTRIGGRYRRRYDDPQTPYERLLASGKLNAKRRRQLERIYQGLDPFTLKEQIETELKPIMRAVARQPGAGPLAEELVSASVSPTARPASEPNSSAKANLLSKPTKTT